MRAASDDPVERWKQHVRGRDVRITPSMPVRTRLRVEPDFVVLVAVVVMLGRPIDASWALFIFATVLLVHEIPQVLLARAVGSEATVELSLFGSRTHVKPHPSGRAAAAFVLLGCFANVVVALLCERASAAALPAPRVFERAAVGHALWASSRLLPVGPVPLGIAIFRRLKAPVRFMHQAASLGVILSVGAFGALRLGAPWLLLFSACVAWAASRRFARIESDLTDAERGVVALARRARDLMLDDRSAEAAALSRRGLAHARSERVRVDLLETLAWSSIAREDCFSAHGALLSLPIETIDVHLLAAYLGSCRRVDEAIDLLLEARQRGQRSAETTRLLVGLLFRRGDGAAGLTIATADHDILTPADLAAVQVAAAT